jgi:hypothetical protein
MKFDLTGKLHKVSPTQVISEKFSKREFVLECENGKYNEYVKCEVINDNIKFLENVEIGYHINAKCYIKGRYFQKKDGSEGLINSIQAYEIKTRANGLTEPVEIYSNLTDNYAPF